MTCVKTQEFLAKNGVTAKEQQDARKKTRGPDGARELLKDADEIYIAKGKNVMHFDLRQDDPGIETVVPMMLGPTGSLRAPTLRKGRMLMVGFNKETYEKLFA